MEFSANHTLVKKRFDPALLHSGVLQWVGKLGKMYDTTSPSFKVRKLNKHSIIRNITTLLKSETKSVFNRKFDKIR